MDIFDRLVELPYEEAELVMSLAADFYQEALKFTQNPRSCKTWCLVPSEGFYVRIRRRNVARKNGNHNAEVGSPKSSVPAGNDVHWLNIAIPSDAIPEIQAMEAEPAIVFERFVYLTTQGYEICVKRKRNSADWFAMVSGGGNDTGGNSFALSAWSDNPISAVCALIWKFEIGLGGQITEELLGSQSGVQRYR